MEWDASTYETFASERERPFHDLLAHVPDAPAGLVVDAGCGTGRTAHLLAARWPDRDVVGVDASARMLESARPGPRVRFEQADLRQWVPQEAPAVVVSNAVLHWFQDPVAALTRLASWLRPAGVLAVQVPANHDAPSHRLVQDAAASPGWADRLSGTGRATECPALMDLARPLLRHGWHVDAWETTYLHVLPGPDPVLRWLQGTTLRPHIAQLGGDATRFLEGLGGALREAYPPLADGRTLFPFTRRFVVAVAPD